MRRLVAVLVLAITAVAAMPGLSAAQDSTTTTTTTTTLPPAVDSPSIIPKPNQGIPPQDAGDRGGALQAATFFFIIGGVAVIGLIVVRQSKSARADRPQR